jgi:hypothetical protein
MCGSCKPKDSVVAECDECGKEIHLAGTKDPVWAICKCYEATPSELTHWQRFQLLFKPLIVAIDPEDGTVTEYKYLGILLVILRQYQLRPRLRLRIPTSPK